MLIRYTAFLFVLLAGLSAAHHPMLARAAVRPAAAASPDAATPSAGAEQRASLAGAMVDRRLCSPETAAEQVARLTPADIEVLLAHPGMLQVAGGMSQRTQAFLIGGLIVAGIIALAAASDGAFFLTN